MSRKRGKRQWVSLEKISHGVYLERTSRRVGDDKSLLCVIPSASEESFLSFEHAAVLTHIPDYSCRIADRGSSPPDRRQWACAWVRPANGFSGADAWKKCERRAVTINDIETHRFCAFTPPGSPLDPHSASAFPCTMNNSGYLFMNSYL